MQSTLALAVALGAIASSGEPGAFAQTDTIDTIDTLTRRIDDLEAREARHREIIAELREHLGAIEAHSKDAPASVERSRELARLARDVLADADTRMGALGPAAMGGWDNGFFLTSEDGAFDLRIKGLVQSRFLLTRRENSSDDTVSGFEIARANLFLSGHIGDPRIGYLVVLASGANGAYGAESAKLTYEVNDELSLYGGRFRNPAFLREEAISYTKQLTVERSTVNEVFTIDYVEGVGLEWRPTDHVCVRGVVHDGMRSARTAFNADATDFAANARVDVLLAGLWVDAQTFTASGTDDTSSVVGAALAYEHGETGTTGANDSFVSWTADASFERGGFAAYGAVIGRHAENEATPDLDQYGVVAQVSHLVSAKLEPYARYEWICYDGFVSQSATGTTANDLRILTAGVNYYLHGHQVKFTADVMYAFDPVSTSRSFTGLLNDSAGEDGQLAFRTQLQFMF